MAHDDSNDDVLKELEAMTTIARVLGMLEQPAARLRVLRWASEKFQLAEGDLFVRLPATAGNPTAASEVNVDELLDIFEVDKPAAAEQVRGKEPLDALVRELAADFQRLALEWHGA